MNWPKLDQSGHPAKDRVALVVFLGHSFFTLLGEIFVGLRNERKTDVCLFKYFFAVQSCTDGRNSSAKIRHFESK
jgi:hypothetical protein